jgi:hypothetical protein
MNNNGTGCFSKNEKALTKTHHITLHVYISLKRYTVTMWKMYVHKYY